MKNFIFVGLFCFVILFSCKEKAISRVTGEDVENISAKELKIKIEEKKVQLIDVRTPEEYANGHIKGASNVNFYDTDFLTQMEQLDRNKPVYLYCRSAGRSGKAAGKLKEKGFTKIYDLKGGILEWKEKGFTVETRK